MSETPMYTCDKDDCSNPDGLMEQPENEVPVSIIRTQDGTTHDVFEDVLHFHSDCLDDKHSFEDVTEVIVEDGEVVKIERNFSSSNPDVHVSKKGGNKWDFYDDYLEEQVIEALVFV